MVVDAMINYSEALYGLLVIHGVSHLANPWPHGQGFLRASIHKMP